MNTANINSLWADVIVEELTRHGVDYFVISPGSRSTPLTAAVAARKETGQLDGEAVVHFDERGAAFHALGYGRATGKPAVLICTSGTAAANYYPAIIEASQDNVPLIALTADRPPELRDTGANQTIDQLNLYGKYVRWACDLPCPDERIDPHMLLTTIDQAVFHALGPPRGPVHLNCPFREPLAPLDDGSDLSEYARQLESWYVTGKLYTKGALSHAKPTDATISAIADAIAGADRGFILAGRLDNEEQRAAVRSLCETLGWPLLADITSGLRFDSSDKVAHYYDLMLASKAFAESVRPDVVLHLGGRFVSKRLLQFIEQAAPAAYVLVNDSPARLDPAHRVTQKIECDVAVFSNLLQKHAQPADTTSCLEQWQKGNRVAQRIINEKCENTTEMTEASAARYISQHLPDQSGLFLASSMPVRDMDMFSGVNDNAIVVAANRGASGIDGTVASATGFAAGLGRPATLLIGDLAFLHDLNSLALVSRSPEPVTVVVLNNNGGGIFEHLPVAKRTDIFEKYFVTPHGYNFEHAAAMFDLPYTQIDDMSAFVNAFGLAQQSERSSLIEVILDRKRDVEFVNSVRDNIADALENRK